MTIEDMKFIQNFKRMTMMRGLKDGMKEMVEI